MSGLQAFGGRPWRNHRRRQQHRYSAVSTLSLSADGRAGKLQSRALYLLPYYAAHRNSRWAAMMAYALSVSVVCWQNGPGLDS